jgi:Macrocin-O-methyltransferase (TylF).
MDAVLAHAGSEPSVIVEAGAYKGGSTAKLSLAASLSNRLLFVFDSFEGMPQHTENHGKNIFGRAAAFPAGSYRGSVEEVTAAVSRFGNLEVCRFVKGWFDDTMPRFHEAVAVAYLDVDLRSSTETCLTYLYPLLVPKGKMFSQDGHLPLILELLTDAAFWTRSLGAVEAPQLVGAGHSKLIEIPREELRSVAALAH